VAGLLNLVYCIADNTDGRQARRTKQTSFTGEYLDHGLDCVTSLMSGFLLMGVLGVSLPLAAVGVLVVAVVTCLSHTINHEHGILIWGNDWVTVDEAMMAFGFGMWIPLFFPDIASWTVPVLCSYMSFLDGLKVVDFLFVLFCLAQLHVMWTMFEMDRTIWRRIPTLFILLNGVWCFAMIPHGSYSSGQYSSDAGTLSAVGKLVVPVVEAYLSYPAMWAVTAACTSSIVCHIPIIAKCASLQRCEMGPLGVLLLVWLVFPTHPVYGTLLAVVCHTAQILFNIRFVQVVKGNAFH
jgi:phosphatidylglycerophosphate synthase